MLDRTIDFVIAVQQNWLKNKDHFISQDLSKVKTFERSCVLEI